MKNNYNYLHPIMAVVFLFVAKTLLAYPQTYSISELFLWIGIIAA